MSTGVFKNGVFENSMEWKPILWQPTSWPGGREAAEGAFALPARSRFGEGRADLLANNIIHWPTMETPFITIRMVTHSPQISAIRKSTKLTLCRLATITTQSLVGGGGEDLTS